MSSTRDPILLLEPSNLLEPLDLADRYVNPADPSARPDRDGTAHGTSPRGFTRTTRRSASVSAPIERRWRLKSALLVAGALACFGAGTALPQLPDLTFGDIKPAQVASASRQSAPAAGAPIKEVSKPAEPRLNESASNGSNQSSNGSNQSIALAPNVDPPSATSVPDQKAAAVDQSVPAAKDAAGGGVTSCDRQGRSNDDANCLAGAVTNPPAGAVRTPVPDRNSDGSPRGASSASRTTTGPIPTKSPASPAAAQSVPETASGQTADPQRADTRASSRQEERPQPALNNNRRASPRDTAERHIADQQPTADDNVPTARSSDRRQDQDTNRTSSRRRDRAAGDSVPSSSASSSDRRPDQDNNRSSSWRRDRYDEYARGDDRRLGRVPREDDRAIAREDDRVTGRGPRYEGPTTIFGPLFGW